MTGVRAEAAEQWAADRESFIADHPELLEDDKLREQVFERVVQMQAKSPRPERELLQAVIDEMNGVQPDPLEAWAEQALVSGDVDTVEAALRYRRTGRLVPEEAPDEPEEDPQFTHEVIGVMGLTRAQSQVDRHLAKVTGRAMGVLKD